MERPVRLIRFTAVGSYFFIAASDHVTQAGITDKAASSPCLK